MSGTTEEAGGWVRQDRLAGLESRLSILESQMLDTKGDVIEIRDGIKDLRDRLMIRPSWGVTVALTGLTSATVGLIVVVASGVGH